jgi:hypothetical protein
MSFYSSQLNINLEENLTKHCNKLNPCNGYRFEIDVGS